MVFSYWKILDTCLLRTVGLRVIVSLRNSIRRKRGTRAYARGLGGLGL